MVDLVCELCLALMLKIRATALLGVTANGFNPSTEEAETGGSLYEFETSLVYIVGSRTARAT